MLWISITLLAVISQLFRNAFSKKLSAKLHPVVVSLCRFLYGLLVITVIYFIIAYFYGKVEIMSSEFFLWVFLFSVCQITANTLWISLFSHKNFAVSISYIKIETIFVAILGMFFLAEKISILGWVGIITALLGLLLASLAKEKIKLTNLKNSFFQKSSYIGISAGIIFAVAAIAAKKSFSFLESDLVLLKSTFALWCTLITQVLLLFPFAFLKHKKDLFEIFKNPKVPFQIGALSGIGSFFWFFAFAIAYVAYVKTLGQIEFILGILMSHYYFKEKIYKNEILGMILMAIGTIILIFQKQL